MGKKIVLLLILFISLNIPDAHSYNKTKAKELENKLKKTPEKKQPPILFQLAKLYIKDKYSLSVKHAKNALDISKKHNLKRYEAESHATLASIYFYSGDFRKAADNYKDELKLRESFGKQKDIALTLYNLGSVYMRWEKEQKAVKHYEECLKYACKNSMHQLILEVNRSLFNIHFDKKRYKKALEYFNDYVRIKDSTFVTKSKQKYAVLNRELEEKDEEIAMKDATIDVIDSTLGEVEKERDTLQVETKRKDEKIEILNYEKAYQEEVIQNQRMLRNFLIIGVGLVIIIAIILLRMYFLKKKTNEMLQMKNEEIMQQKEEIEAQRDHIGKQNKHITDSIVYAQRIQEAALPDKEIKDELGYEHFVLYKPRDIVSGDFYWMKRIEKHVVIVAADCTGHGVPGAFVSMLGMSFLNEIIPNEKFDMTAADILEKLRILVKKQLKQTGRESEPKDGMDIALCVINENDNTLQYAGAHNPLFQIRNNELNVVKATLNPIGIHFREMPFENNVIQLQKGDMYYIFSDGYLDQFGGEKGDKFSKKQFKQLVLNIHDRMLVKQEEVLDNVIEKWKGIGKEQIDDILVVGFKI